MPDLRSDPQQELYAVYRREYSRILASLISYLRDFELAEDALQDAFEAALKAWPEKGLPTNPGAWLTTTAKRKAIDRLRHHRTESFDPQEQAAEGDANWAVEEDFDSMDDIPDERLKLMFTCSHPALPLEHRVALTLQTLGGLTTGEIASAFLTSKVTMAQRLVRAKRKIKKANIPYYVPPAHLLTERLDGVLAVLYLIFTEGYAASSGAALIRLDLCQHAIYLTRTLERLIRNMDTDVSQQQQAEVLGLLALMLLNHARREARLGENGRLITLQHQDRTRWKQPLIQEGTILVEKALLMRAPGSYQIQAAISALHAEAPSFAATDWPQIVQLYGQLRRFQDNPIIRLNQAVAISYAQGPTAGLKQLAFVADALHEQAIFHLAKADMLARLGKSAAANKARRAALPLTQNEVERQFIQAQIDSASKT